MMNENLNMYLDIEEMIDMRDSTMDLDLVLEVLESDLADFTFPPNGPQLSPKLSLQQPVLPAPEFHAAPNGFPLGPTYYIPDEERFGPQQPQTEGYLNLGADPFSLQQPVLPAPEFHAAPNGFPLGPTYYIPDEERFGPQQPQTEGYLNLGADPFSLQQPVLPAPEFHAAPNGFPLGPTYYIPDEERFGPQQPQTECYINLGADPFSLQQPVMPPLAYPMYQPPTVMQQNYMYCQADPFNHSQFNNMPGMTLPQGLGTNLVPLGFMNGNIVYGVPNYVVPPDTFDSPEVEDSPPQRRKFNKQPEDESKPYVKKPLNAFMIYLMEQRPGVMAELPNSDCAAVNRIIGQRWQSLTKEEQAKYYKRADAERELHSQRFPEWSAVDNYGLKRKRVRRKAPAKTKDSST